MLLLIKSRSQRRNKGNFLIKGIRLMSSIGTYKPYFYIVILCVYLWVTCHVNELLFDRQFSF